jgi:phage/plasmid-like protein (TIGR03299 family)
LVGLDKRAWHYSAAHQGAESNHYPGPIPIEDVRRRLFSWQAIEGDVQSTATIIDEHGVETFTITDPNRKTMLRPPGALGPDDKGAILGVFMSGYADHQYEEWLLNTVARIIDANVGDLVIGSAALLKGGAQAFVSIEVPENITTPEGVEFRPRLLSTTSFDGSLATGYKRVVMNAICDNTMRAALAEKGQQIKVKHSKYSKAKLMEARDALAIVLDTGEEFAAQVAALTATKVSEGDWARFLDQIAPLTKDGEEKQGRSLTMAKNRREEMTNLWRHDERVAPWRGTAWGVVQAVNTHAHHIQTVRGSERAERNMSLAVTGGFDRLDAETMDTLHAVLV